jgi:hypothetical protein
MNTYTDEQLLDKTGAVELLPTLPVALIAKVRPPYVPIMSSNDSAHVAESASWDEFDCSS